MLPKYDDYIIALDDETKVAPTKTYEIDWDRMRISPVAIDELRAMEQAIDLALSIERFWWAIYDDDYGSELFDTVGMQMTLAIPESERYIREALAVDDRILDVRDFQFEPIGEKLTVYFTVETIFGVFEKTWEVSL